jgi:hypothetical protein
MGIRKLLLVSCLLGLASVAGAQEELPPPPEGGGEDMPPPPPPDGEAPVGTCITPVGPCEGEGACGEGGQCLDGLCVLTGNECKGPADCDERSACYVIGNPCEGPEQCRDPFICQANFCVALLLGPPPDGMCPPDDTMCQMGGEPFSCMDASQCSGGDCVEGQCIFREGEQCMDESCVTAVGTDSDGDGIPDAMDQDAPSEQEIRDQIEDQKEMQMAPLACTVSTGSSKLGGLGLLLALSTLILRRRR